jgi:hypothetical protein
VTQYEALRTERGKLKTSQAVALMAPTAAMAGFVFYAVGVGGLRFPSVLATIIFLPIILHRVWRFIFSTYRAWSDRSSQISAEIAILRRRVDTIFDKYRTRQKGEHFKKAYNLIGRSVAELEEALSVGMYRERREVFVTAFIRHGIAVRVTASIGSPFRCSASDNPGKWRRHFERLGCDEIRQYHNHPDHNGSTRPSATDVKTTRSIKDILAPHGSELRSLIICWNSLREWKVFEHDGDGRQWLRFEFDAAS